MVVQSIVHLSGGASVDLFKSSVVGRIEALARTHSLLAASRWNAVAIRPLIAEELEPFASEGGRIACDGPELNLKPAAAQSLGLVIHELVTNSAKYGALSKPGGRVDVRWFIEVDRLCIDWQESAGPPITSPSRSGFGSALMRITIERQLRGKLDFDWARQGLRCQIAVDRNLATADPKAALFGEVDSSL